MELILKNVECNGFKDLSMNFKNNKIIGIYDDDNSNLCEIISLLHPIKYGQIKLDEYIYVNKKVPKDIRKKIGYISKYSEENFFNTTVKKELELALKLFDEDINIDLIIEVMQMVDLDIEFLDRDPFTLSSGEKRKLSLASVLIYKPEIIIIDNPFISLDYSAKKNIMKLLLKLKNNYNKTIIITSNDLEEIYQISDWVYILKNNNIILEGNKSVIYKQKEILIKNNIYLPQIISFSDYVFMEKNVKLGYRHEMNDLIKDIYRHAR